MLSVFFICIRLYCVGFAQSVRGAICGLIVKKQKYNLVLIASMAIGIYGIVKNVDYA